ncbi:molybdate ABC transporter substrate-binding protein [Stappia sp.]|uniref:molybdate ABC transporter substrate-binding protein n=1 Tax=Stappia sp. TaxID=1870903 RepID=UPI003D0B87F2
MSRHALAVAIVGAISLAAFQAMAETTVKLHAASSLKAAMSEIADAYEARTEIRVERNFGPSGLLRERIERGEAAEVFASANMTHPTTLASTGKALPVVLFARNRLCALVQPKIKVNSSTLLETILRDDIRVGTSTPKDDPSGDYAFELFDKAEAMSPGATARLKAKALKLTGGRDSEAAPEGRNKYGWIMENKRADIFLTYCTNALLAKREVSTLSIVQVPEPLAVGADYGLTVMNGASPDAFALALHILSPKGQAILVYHGFDAPGFTH